MAEYIKKVLIFNEIKKGFAVSAKTVSGIFKLEKIGLATSGKIYITNYNSGNLGEVVAVVKIDNNEKNFTLDVLNDFEFKAPTLNANSDVDCLLAVKQGREYIPFLYATNRAVGISHKLAASLTFDSDAKLPQPTKVLHNTEDEGYEKFVAATDNYYLKENEVKPLDIKNLLKDTTIQSLDSYENKFMVKDSYYLKVASEIENLFETYPTFQPLIEKIPNSTWVKIDGGDSFFVFGLITDDGLPKYICYGLPSQFIVKRGLPNIPLLSTAQEGGFYILYQNAIDGSLI